MTIMAASYALSTQREAALLSHAHERAKGVALANGGIYYAMMMLLLPDPKLRWRSDGTPYFWNIQEARVRIRILDESGKVDLNAAQELTLKTVLKYVVHDEDKATRLAGAILDWKDPNDEVGLFGAEAGEYKAAGTKQVPQNRNFMVMEELRSVLGVTPELYRSLESWFTIYSGQDGINPQKVSREQLVAMLGGDRGAADAFVAQRLSEVPPVLPPVPGLKFTSGGEAVYTVTAMAEIPGQSGAGVRAIIKRGRGADGAPFAFLSWKPLRGSGKSAD
jgi:general secretion pathway protein K